MVPISTTDGVDASYRASLAGASNTVQVAAGRADSRFPGAISIARGMLMMVDTFESGPLTVRATWGRSRITLPAFEPVFDGFRLFGPQGKALADRFSVSRLLVPFYGAGASYDPGPWFVMGEWVAIKADAALGARSAWYLSAGRRFGKLTPYATYSRARAGEFSDTGLSLAGLTPEQAAAAAGLNAALNTILSSKIAQGNLSVGARWDFRRNAALKLQLDHVRVTPGSSGSFGNIQPGRPSGSHVNLLSATLDFTF